MRSDLYGEYVG